MLFGYLGGDSKAVQWEETKDNKLMIHGLHRR